MINIGLLYTKKKVIKQLKRYIKAQGLRWKDVYSVSMVVETDVKNPTVVFGGFVFKAVHKGLFLDVFPEGWEKRGLF